MLKIMIAENWAEKPPPPPLFCLFVMDRTCITQVSRIPKVPILQIHTQIAPIRIFSIGYQLLSTFQNTHIYRTTGLRIMVHMEGL